jgi:hypothetical protein
LFFLHPSAELCACALQSDSLLHHLPRLERAEQHGSEKILIWLTPPIDSLKLPDEFIFCGTEKIFFDNLPVDSTRYRLDCTRGILYLRYLFRDSSAHRLEVRYQALPFALKREYVRREILFPISLDSTLQSETLRAPIAGRQSRGLYANWQQ